MTNLPPSFVECHEIGYSISPGTLWACTGFALPIITYWWYWIVFV